MIFVLTRADFDLKNLKCNRNRLAPAKRSRLVARNVRREKEGGLGENVEMRGVVENKPL